MPNVFLSFLGTSKYESGSYWLDFHGDRTQGLSNTSYVQLALLKYLTDQQELTLDIGNPDKSIIVVTKDALAKNWFRYEWTDWKTEKKETTDGLREGLIKMLGIDVPENPELPEHKNEPVVLCDIPDGKNEEELWQIFQRIYDAVPENANLHLDITHAFRFMPMLGIVLINYLRLLKNVNIKEIYYGNWEAREKINELNHAPIYRLNSFVELIDWTNAAGEFVNNGNMASLSKMLKEKQPLNTDLGEKLEEFAMNLLTVRGGSIVAAKSSIESLRRNLKKELSREDLHEAVEPILGRVRDKLSEFESDSIQNGLAGIRWCLEHGLIQQGITLLQEFVITYICIETSNIPGVQSYQIARKEHRYEIRDLLNSHNNADRLDIEDWSSLKSIYQQITDYRNDINHAGFMRQGNKPNDWSAFMPKLQESYDKLKKIVG